MGSSHTEQKHDLKYILSFLMEECDIDDITLSRDTGVPASTISRMRLKSNANPTASTLRPISKYFSISISQLLGDEPLPSNRLPGTHNPISFTSARIPILEWGWVGQWLAQELADIREKIYDSISTEKKVCDKAFALTINTESFGIAFRKGSIIIVDPKPNPKDNDIVLIECEEEILLKQFLKDGKDIYIRSINPEMKGIILLSEKQKILGVVIETRFSLQTFKDMALQKQSEGYCI